MDLPEANLRVRDAHAPGAAVTCVVSQRSFSPARQLVQEMMILAGQIVGDLGAFQAGAQHAVSRAPCTTGLDRPGGPVLGRLREPLRR